MNEVMASQYKTIHPLKYLRDYLTQDIRPDGREFLRFRPVSVNVGSVTEADGSAIFKIGNTAVICGIKAELAIPRADRPDCGYVIPNVELPSLSSPKFRPGPPSDEAQIATQMVNEIFTNSEAIDLKELCICKDKLAWVLYCDLICIDYDGSVIDACLGALMAAFKTLTLPHVEYNAETEVTVVHSTKRIPVNVKNFPVSITFAVFEDQLLIADPTDDEESLSLGKLSVVIKGEELCGVYKPGGIPISQEILSRSLTKAKKRAQLITKLINTAIASPKSEKSKKSTNK